MTTGLLIGRFQPFHNGHLAYIKKILKECNKLIILIGSAQEKNTQINPFSAEERKKMIKSCLKDNPNIKILSARDYPGENEKWLAQIERKTKFDVVYCGENKLVMSIFSEVGFKVKTLARINNISSSRIRELIVMGKDYADLVPLNVYLFLKNKGAQRIRNIYNKNKFPNT